jgi:hypothetical protein
MVPHLGQLPDKIMTHCNMGYTHFDPCRIGQIPVKTVDLPWRGHARILILQQSRLQKSCTNAG